MSAAHAETATKKMFARVFMHTGMVALDGQKMSKSLGNLVFVSKLIKNGIDPMAIRLTILANHYRSDWEWFERDLEQGIVRLANWRQAFAKANGASDCATEVLAVLTDDLDTPKVLQLIDDWAAKTNAGRSDSKNSPKYMAHLVDALLGII